MFLFAAVINWSFTNLILSSFLFALIGFGLALAISFTILTFWSSFPAFFSVPKDDEALALWKWHRHLYFFSRVLFLFILSLSWGWRGICFTNLASSFFFRATAGVTIKMQSPKTVLPSNYLPGNKNCPVFFSQEIITPRSIYLLVKSHSL